MSRMGRQDANNALLISAEYRRWTAFFSHRPHNRGDTLAFSLRQLQSCKKPCQRLVPPFGRSLATFESGQLDAARQRPRRHEFQTVGERGDPNRIDHGVVTMGQRIAHGFVQGTLGIFDCVRRRPIRLVEYRIRLAIKKRPKAPCLIDQRSGDLMPFGMGIRTVGPRIDRKQAECTWNELLDIAAKQQHGEVSWTQHTSERLLHAKWRYEWAERGILRQKLLDTGIRNLHAHLIQAVPQRQQVEILLRRAGTGLAIPGFGGALADKQIQHKSVARLNGGTSDAHECFAPSLPRLNVCGALAAGWVNTKIRRSGVSASNSVAKGASGGETRSLQRVRTRPTTSFKRAAVRPIRIILGKPYRSFTSRAPHTT